MKLYWISILFCQIVISQTNPNHVHVRGYTKSDGTYVAPYVRTAPNATNSDNFSTIGNTNPYTGESGYIPSDGGTPRYRTYNNTSSTYTSASSYSYPSNITYSSSTNRNLNSINSSNRYDYYDVYDENRLLKKRITDLETELSNQKESISYLQEDYRLLRDSFREAQVIAQNLVMANYKTNDSLQMGETYESPEVTIDSNEGDYNWPIIIAVGIIIFFIIIGKK